MRPRASRRCWRSVPRSSRGVEGERGLGAQIQQRADARGVVRGVRLALAGAERVVEAGAALQVLEDRAGLIAVADDLPAVVLDHRLVDDEARVLDLALIQRFGPEAIPIKGEPPVPAVGTTAHDEVDDQPLLTTILATNHQPTAGIGIVLQMMFERIFGNFRWLHGSILWARRPV